MGRGGPLDGADRRHALRFGVIGAGRLGRALAAALAGAGYGEPCLTGHDRVPDESAVAGVRAVDREALLAASDVVVLAVPDGEIEPLASDLPWVPGQAAVHCSGALGLDVLTAARSAGARAGTLHPLQTFPAGESPERAADRFHGIACGVEGDGDLGELLAAVAEDLGARPISLFGVDRAAYHAAAVLASNHVTALMSAATGAWEVAGLDRGDARAALAPLMSSAADAVAGLPLERALTGPVARGDVATVRRHLDALAGRPQLRELYRRLSLELLSLDLGHDESVEVSLRSLLGEESGA